MFVTGFEKKASTKDHSTRNAVLTGMVSGTTAASIPHLIKKISRLRGKR